MEKQLLQRLDALQEMMGRGAETQPQGEGEVAEKVQYSCIRGCGVYIRWYNTDSEPDLVDLVLNLEQVQTYLRRCMG